MFDIIDIQEKINYKFENLELLFAVFTHSSYANENGVESYERYEFLGDSILSFVTAIYLFRRFPDENEGMLTKIRAQIVNTKALARAIEKLHISHYMRTAGGALSDDIKNSDHVKEDIFEAIVGAIMVDSGLEECEKFILRNLEDVINAEYTHDNISDNKSKLLEYCAKHGLRAFFSCEAIEGGFHATLTINGRVMGEGDGTTKKKAEQNASKVALLAING